MGTRHPRSGDDGKKLTAITIRILRLPTPRILHHAREIIFSRPTQFCFSLINNKACDWWTFCRLFKAFGQLAFKQREWPMLGKLIAMNAYNGTLLWERDLAPGR